MTRRTRSSYEIFQEASLSQKASFKIPILKRLVGTDPELSDSIAVLIFLEEQKFLAKKDTKFLLGLLDVLRLSHFATSEKLNEISKLGFLMPKAEDIISKF